MKNAEPEETPGADQGAGVAPGVDPKSYDSRCLQPVTALPGVGPKIAATLARKNIRTIEDLLLSLPYRYEDRRVVTPIAALQEGQAATIRAVVERIRGVGGRGRLRRTLAHVVDESGGVDIVWFGFAGMRFNPQDRVVLSGDVTRRDERLQIVNPEGDVLGADEEPAGLVPVYSETEGLRQRSWRKLIAAALDRFAGDWVGGVPDGVRAERGLATVVEALRTLHRPPNGDVDPAALLDWRGPARRALAFEEYYVFQLGMAVRRRMLDELPGVRLELDDETLRPLRAALPFALTAGQEECWRAIAADLSAPRPMQRLIHGEVGSGKTALAILAAGAAARNDYQTAVMAPTEILAAQHARRFAELLTPLGVRVALVTGGLARPERRRLCDRIALGMEQVVVGTHALLSGDVEFHRLGLAVVDEQHKFGVAQRARLATKGERPNVLALSATPIPRSLALTIYGDLDLSLLRERPHGVGAIATRVVGPEQRAAAYRELAGRLAAGRQGYVVCPRLDRATDGKADALSLYEELRAGPLAGFRLAVLHGQTPPAAGAEIVAGFLRREIHAIVSTSVIEVGLDAPNAAALVVENAELFGLSQLHQMRGRIGRDGQPALCLLLHGADCPAPARERLAYLARCGDGFAIAEYDLRLRGPGELLGVRQSGLPRLRFAKWTIDDLELLQGAREAARRTLDADPLLADPRHEWAKMTAAQRWGAALSAVVEG